MFSITLFLGLISPGLELNKAIASTPGVVGPVASTATPSTSHDPGDFLIQGFNSEELLVSVGFVNAPSGTTFSFSSGTGNLEPAAGYESTTWTNLDRISFYATQSEANTALASLSVVAGNTLGDFQVKVSATLKVPGLVYNPKNDHFYEFVSGGVTWASAFTGAAGKSAKGVAGYLATITSQDETLFVANNVTTATKLWVAGAQVYGGTVGSEDSSAEWKWVAGPENNTTFWTKPSIALGGTTVNGVYSNWCSNEPNGLNEPYVVIRWQSTGDTNCWNDWAGTNTSGGGYIVEYGSNAEDKGYTGVYTATTNITVNYPITNLSVTAGNAQAYVDWDAPTGGTVTGYTVTSTPGSRACSTTTNTACTVVGLTNGTAYTFQVVASFSGTIATSVSTSGSITPVDSAPGLSGPTTASTLQNESVTLGSFTISDPFSCGWGEMTATVSAASGAFGATASGSAVVSGTGTSTLTVRGSRVDVQSTLATVTFEPSVASGNLTSKQLFDLERKNGEKRKDILDEMADTDQYEPDVYKEKGNLDKELPAKEGPKNPTTNPIAQSLDGTVWLDINRNGFQEDNEPYMSNIQVTVAQGTSPAAASGRFTGFGTGAKFFETEFGANLFTQYLDNAINKLNPVINGVRTLFGMGTTYTVYTDKNGYFIFKSLASGDWYVAGVVPAGLDVTYDSAGVSDATVDTTVPAGGHASTWIGLMGDSTTGIRSLVLDPSGKPVTQDVVITASGTDGIFCNADDVSFVITPVNGVIEMSGLINSSYYVRQIGSTATIADFNITQGQIYTSDIKTVKGTRCALLTGQELAATGGNVDGISLAALIMLTLGTVATVIGVRKTRVNS